MKSDKDSHYNKAFKWSLGIHGGFFLVLLISLLVGWIKNRQEPYVFTLEATAPLATSEQNTVADANDIPDENEIDKPEIPEVKQLEKPVELKTLEKQDPPEVVEEKPQSISYEEYVKKFGQPKSNSRPVRKNNRKIEVSEIDVSQMTEDLRNRTLKSSERVQSGNAVNANAIDRFKAAIYNRILRSWRKPQGYQGDDLQVIVFLTVEANGNIRFLGFKESSGNRIFDQSVKDAVLGAGSAGKPPNGLPDSLWMVFKMN